MLHITMIEFVLDFRYAAPFQNQSGSKTTWIENRRQISDFLTPGPVFPESVFRPRSISCILLTGRRSAFWEITGPIDKKKVWR